MNKHNNIYFTGYNDNVSTSENRVFNADDSLRFDLLNNSESEESERLRKLFSKKLCRI